MARRGRCRCGEILTFRRGPNGYKQRCPKCGAGVRLRVGKHPRKEKRQVACVCGTILLVGKRLSANCPTCGRPLAAAFGTQAEGGADASAAPVLQSAVPLSSIPMQPAPAPAVAAVPTAAPPVSPFPLLNQDVNLNPVISIDREMPEREPLANAGANSMLEQDRAPLPTPQRASIWTSSRFWLAVCGLLFLLVCLAVAGVVVVMQLMD